MKQFRAKIGPENRMKPVYVDVVSQVAKAGINPATGAVSANMHDLNELCADSNEVGSKIANAHKPFKDGQTTDCLGVTFKVSRSQPRGTAVWTQRA